MNSVEHIFRDLVSSMASFLVHTLAPWAWDHKFWIATLIPLIVIIAIAKWMWD